MRKINNSYRCLNYETIIMAVKERRNIAIEEIVQVYQGYICACALREIILQNGKKEKVVDEELKQTIENGSDLKI